MCDTRDGELLPDLIKVARGTIEKKLRLLAIRGCVRLATREEGVKLSNADKLATLKNILDAPLEAAEKRAVLSGAGAIPDVGSLALAAAMLEDSSVQSEAAQAVIQIADAVAAAHPDEAAGALKKVLALAADPAAQDSARQALNKILKLTGYITLWQVAGPYVQEGKNYSELFDIAFPPETAEAGSVHWQTLPAGSGADSWKMDLLRALGGEQRVAYARTWVNSPKEQTARLEIGADDGVKVWFNDKLVHANNISRALRPASDVVDVTLDRGWNKIMLKVTQNIAGWEFCARFAEPGGEEPVAGLRASLNPPKQ